MPSPIGIDLDQYRTQAKDLLAQARAGDPSARARVRRYHPDPDAALGMGRPRLVDCQVVLARELGFPSWTSLKHYLLFRHAVAAIDAGDVASLATLLRPKSPLLRYHCHVGEWYAEGYFRGATLLHHVAGNPIRCPLPANVVDVARLLLDRGADPNATTANGWTTIGLLLTSRQASEAGVALHLIDLLHAAGARDDLSGDEVVTWPLLEEAPATAAELVRRGARIDVRHAAGLGRLDRLEALLAEERDPAVHEEALAFACIRGQVECVRMLVRHGVRGDVLVSPGGRTPRTALHEAAHRGHLEIVKLLLEFGASTTVVEPNWGGTPADWARHAGHTAIAALLWAIRHEERRPRTRAVRRRPVADRS